MKQKVTSFLYLQLKLKLLQLKLFIWWMFGGICLSEDI